MVSNQIEDLKKISTPEFIQVIFNSALDAIICTDENYKIILANETSCKLTGYNHQEIYGKDISYIIKDEKNDLKKILENSLKNIDRCLAIRNNNSQFPVGISSHKINLSHNNQIIFIIFLHNLSHENEIENKITKFRDRLALIHFEMQKARYEAEKANYHKSLFLANMSHEIRTPLNGILGMTELLMNTELSEKQQKYMNRIYEAGDLLLSIINDILDFSKIEAGQMHLDITECNLVEIINNAYNILSVKAKANNTIINIITPDNLPQVMADQLRLNQVILNLLSNAIKFTKNGKIEIKLQTAILETDEMNIMLSIKDSGIGIAKEALVHIFDKFSQADISTTRKYGGTGLGLAICKKIIEMMDGKISVTSEVGKGSNFYFNLTLPIYKNEI